MVGVHFETRIYQLPDRRNGVLAFIRSGRIYHNRGRRVLYRFKLICYAIKEEKISELNEASDMKGFFTIGYRVINGVKTSLKFGLEKIQTALDNMLKATSDAKQLLPICGN